MTLMEIPVSGRFPEENIHTRHGRIHVQNMIATVALVSPEPPSQKFTLRIVRVVMRCTGNLDTHTILVEDVSLLRMFVEKDETLVIDLGPLDTAIPIFALEAAGPTPDNDGKEDNEVDFDMLNTASNACRLVWGRDFGLAKLSRQIAKAKAKREAELAAQAIEAEHPRRPEAQPKSLIPGRRQSKQTRRSIPVMASHAASSKEPHSIRETSPSVPTTKRPRIRIGGIAIPEPDDALVLHPQNDIDEAHADQDDEPVYLDESRPKTLVAEDQNDTSDDEDFLVLTSPKKFVAKVQDKEVSGRSEEDVEYYDEGGYDDENDEDGEYFEQTTAAKTKCPGIYKARQPSKKALGKHPAKSTAPAAPRKGKPRIPTEMIWPSTIITSGTAGGHLRPLMEEMGQTLTTEAERQEYMDLVWTRRRTAGDDNVAMHVVVDDLETFVRQHGIVHQHNLWARWMESGMKVAMPMYTLIGTGEMDAVERKQMFERKKKARQV